MKLQAVEPGTFLAEIRHSYLEDLEKGNGSPTQYSCLGNPMTRRSLAGYSSWGYKRVRHDLATKQPQQFRGLQFNTEVLSLVVLKSQILE